MKVGAFRSSKSVFNVLAFCIHLEKCTDPLHIAIAANASTAESVIGNGGGLFGVRQYFAERCEVTKYAENKALKIETKTGTKYVVFFGGAKANSYEGFRGWSIGSIIAEEIDLLHENTLTELKGRIFMSTEPKMFLTHNPTNPRHPIYTWLEELQSNASINYMHTTLEDNPAMTEERKNEIKSEFDPRSIFYKRYILGLRVVAEALIYNFDKDKNILKELDLSKYIKYVIVIDHGSTVSATAITSIGLTIGFKEMDVLAEYYHRNKDNSNDIVFNNIDDDSEQLAVFIKQQIEVMNRYPDCVIFDGDDGVRISIEKALKNARLGNIRTKRATKGLPGEQHDQIVGRIRFLSSLLYSGRFRILEKCKHSIESIETSQWDPKKLKDGIEERLDQPENGTNCDCEDTIHYAMIYYYDLLRRFLK